MKPTKTSSELTSPHCPEACAAFDIVVPTRIPQRLTSPLDVAAVVDFVRRFKPAILTGAGCSTESGIPDYRGPETRRRARNPMTGRTFLSDSEKRKHYWSRSVLGWPKIRDAPANSAHRALAELQARHGLGGLVTQNVDGLHQKAGSEGVVELHGSLAQTICLDCGQLGVREDLQNRLLELNRGRLPQATELAPDGDVDTDAFDPAQFIVPGCGGCGGALKPHVVFFGESVPKPVVARAFAIVDDAPALLVVGSSLAVFSGFRFVRHANRADKPIMIVNLGPTRGDPLAQRRIDAVAGDVLPRVVEALDDSAPSEP